MAFSPPVLGCLVKKSLQKGRSQAPQDPPPGYVLGSVLKYVFLRLKAENDLSPTALVAGLTSNSYSIVEILLDSFLREI